MNDLVELLILIGPFILGIFAYDLARRWWRENEWKRRLKRRLKEERRAARH